jgi:DNA polymerase III alpha subunit
MRQKNMKTNKILPVFKSHYSVGRSILSLKEAGTSIPGGPDSIIDICIEKGIEKPFLVDDSIGSFLEAVDSFGKAEIDFVYGLRISFCENMKIKTKESRFSEWKGVILMNSIDAYESLIEIWNLAATKGFYHEPRLDLESLKKIWSNDLFTFVVPFYDNHFFKNMFTFDGHAVPVGLSFINKIHAFSEDNDLIYDDKIKESFSQTDWEILPAKSIFYNKRVDFKTFLTRKCIAKRSTLEKPNLTNMTSAEFCAESWKEQQNG